jgi:hypothetical protein
MYGYGLIKDYEDYVIRSDGVVINIITKREIKGCIKDGYRQVGLTNEGKEKKVRIHRLLGKAFIDGEDETHNTIDHLDQNRANNDLSNLRWATRTEQNINRKHKPSNTGEPHIHLTTSNTYFVRIQRNKKCIYNKKFKTFPEAINARDEFKNSMVV